MSIRYCIFFFLYYQWILKRVEYPQHKICALQQHVQDVLELESLSLGLRVFVLNSLVGLPWWSSG